MRPRSISGFTLMELLLVLVIHRAPRRAGGPDALSAHQARQGIRGTRADRKLRHRARRYVIDVGRFPSTQEGLKALRSKPKALRSGTVPISRRSFLPIRGVTPTYIARRDAAAAMKSFPYGADGREGGEGDNADINSWEAAK